MSGDDDRATGELARGLNAYAQRAWLDAHRALSHADASQPLDPGDLELLATSAYMLGRDDDYLRALERAHQAFAERGDLPRAARCGFWIGLNLMVRGEGARATGWFARADRVLDRVTGECVERGYLLLPAVLRAGGAGDWEQASDAAALAAEIAERHGDPDLLALAVHEQGHALVRRRRVDEGLRLLDEAMVAATAGELSPIVTGIVYCSVIGYCGELYELRRAREWTDALSHWCAEQPDMVAHTGVCLTHRAEVMVLRGAWPEALEEAVRARERCEQGRAAAGHAIYLQAEVRRLRGELAAAEDAYREASRYGFEPQPGLALLWLARGNVGAAAAAIRRASGETTDPLRRARLLPACVEIVLAAGEVDEAEGPCRELEQIASGRENVVLGAIATRARGAVTLARGGDPGAALVALRRALEAWQELDAPYEAARTRVSIAIACRELGDKESAALEEANAREAFEALGAVPDQARLSSLGRRVAPSDSHGLTPRELEVLCLLAAGVTNKEIAAELVLSERTVHRHVSNIFTKLGVSSRAAATAFAYEHELL